MHERREKLGHVHEDLRLLEDMLAAVMAHELTMMLLLSEMVLVACVLVVVYLV